MSRKNGRKVSYHQRILALLAADGEWHTLKQIYKTVARFIDSAVADAEYRKRHPHWHQDAEALRVAAGKKRLLFLSLNSAIHHRKIVEARGHDWNRRYRLNRGALAARQNSKADE